MAEYNEVIAPLPYFGNIGFYSHLLQADMIVDVHEHYVKQSLRNRCELLDSQGRFSLTVPVHRPSGMKTAMTDIRISYDSDWRRIHRRSITSAYGSSPFFIHYWDDLKQIWDAEPVTLVELNLAAHRKISELIGITPELRMSEDYIISSPGLDLRKDFKKGTFEHPRYIQVFEGDNGFEQDLSILDLLFCIGPEAADYLRGLGQ